MKINNEGVRKLGLLVFMVVLVAVGFFQLAASTPYGPSLISTSTEGVDIGNVNGLMMNDTKGRITRVELNATQPDEDWKGYAGNVSGKLKLIDAANNTLFDWTLAAISGEVYATRASSAPTWTSMACASHAQVAAENSAMGHGSEVDNITNTFDNGNHKQVTVGGNTISADSCDYSNYMYVSSASQASTYSEVLLYDGSDLVYTTVLENAGTGYDGGKFDFQMIVADNQDTSVNTGYYFYVELA